MLLVVGGRVYVAGRGDAGAVLRGGGYRGTEGVFAQGGWIIPYWHDEIGTHFTRVMGESDAFLLGRKTWQVHASAWEPMPAGDPLSDVLYATPKYVVSSTLADASVQS